MDLVNERMDSLNHRMHMLETMISMQNRLLENLTKAVKRDNTDIVSMEPPMTELPITEIVSPVNNDTAAISVSVAMDGKPLGAGQGPDVMYENELIHTAEQTIALLRRTAV
jgi:uncharacterized coiled-coil protein SlyX